MIKAPYPKPRYKVKKKLNYKDNLAIFVAEGSLQYHHRRPSSTNGATKTMGTTKLGNIAVLLT